MDVCAPLDLNQVNQRIIDFTNIDKARWQI